MGTAFSIVFAQLVIGGFAMLVFVPPQILGAGFYRFMGGLYFGLFLASVWVSEQVDTANLGISHWTWTVGGILGLYALLTWTRFRSAAYFLTWIFLPLGSITLWEKVQWTRVQWELASSPVPFIGSFHLSSALLGSSMTAMLFGHWYLTTPELPTRYLRRMNHLVLGALVLSAAWNGAVIAFSWQELFASGYLSWETFGGIFLWARALVGIAAAFVCGLFTWHCLREDSTQAATGFLYLVVCFVFMGEILGRFLLDKTHLPL